MYCQPSPLQGFLPLLESFGQPFSMTRSVLVIAPFSTTFAFGMVNFTVFSLPSWALLQLSVLRGLWFRL